MEFKVNNYTSLKKIFSHYALPSDRETQIKKKIFQYQINFEIG